MTVWDTCAAPLGNVSVSHTQHRPLTSVVKLPMIASPNGSASVHRLQVQARSSWLTDPSNSPIVQPASSRCCLGQKLGLELVVMELHRPAGTFKPPGSTVDSVDE